MNIGDTKPGDRVRICWDGRRPGRALIGSKTWVVAEVCPRRGVRIYTRVVNGKRLRSRVWERSWVRVKGGAS
jgi:hypothetical protein